MANPNRKIVITEIDETRPLGAGVSSDVAYVPGLAVEELSRVEKADGSIEVTPTLRGYPVLCNTVADLEAAFGTEPYRFTEDDIVGGTIATTLGIQEGDFDKSYIYAKELLQRGMSVYYENISAEYKPEDEEVESAAQVAIVAENISSVGNNKFELTNITSKRGQTATFDVELIKNKFNAGYGVVRFNWHFPETMPTGTSFGLRTYIVNFNDYEVIAKRATVEADWMIEPATLVLPTFCIGGNEQPHTLILDENTAEDALEARVTGIKAEIPAGLTEIVKWMGIEPALFDSMTLQCSMVINWHTAVGIPVEFEVDAVVGSESTAAEDEPSTGKLNYFYNHLGDAYSRLEDKNEYTVKYVTSGGYPLFGVDNDLVATLMTLADTRGDVLAIVDHVDMPNAPHGTAANGSIYKQVMQANLGRMTGAAASAMFTPWGKYTFATTAIPDEMSIYMPASFGYLLCMAAAIKTSPNWLAMAGVTRGMVPNLVSLHTNSVLSNTIAEDYQPKFGTNDNNLSINAITNIKPYGLCIWGNRTLLPMDPKGAVAHNFLNTRNMMSDIKKVAYDTAKKLMFEQDSTALWLSFKAGITPLLDQLKVGNGISNYKILRSDVKYSNKERVTRGELAAIIRVYPRFAIEYFDIAVAISEEEVSVS